MLTIIIPFLNSHEIVRRQIIHFKNMDLPDEVETIFMDDGSTPALELPEDPPRNFRIHATNDFRPWTSSLARNTGAKIARGDYLLMTDGDYILTREAILHSLAFRGDRQGFRRKFGVLNSAGELQTDSETLLAHGVNRNYLEAKHGWIGVHPNNFVIRKTLFEEMGGYREDLILSRPYPQGEDRWFKRRLMEMVGKGRAVLPTVDDRQTIYMFPNGQYCGDVDYNPFGLFHELTRKTENNYWFKHQRYQ